MTEIFDYPHWNALSALAGWAAVFTSLYLASQSSRQLRRDRREAARTLRVRLIVQLTKIYRRLNEQVKLASGRDGAPACTYDTPALEALQRIEELSAQFHLLTSHEYNMVMTAFASASPTTGSQVALSRATDALVAIGVVREDLMKSANARPHPWRMRLLAKLHRRLGRAIPKSLPRE